jgi:hypothetical protein
MIINNISEAKLTVIAMRKLINPQTPNIEDQFKAGHLSYIYMETIVEYFLVLEA